MRTIRLRLHVPDKPASDVYATLANFERYPQLCDAVQKVTVTERSGNLTVSQWEVTFRAGLLCWTEEDTFDPGALTITFRQLEGDVAVFDGSWRCVDDAQGSEVLFSADLDLGIPSLADALEPIAARTLIANIISIVRGLVGSAELVASDTEVPVGSASGTCCAPSGTPWTAISRGWTSTSARFRCWSWRNPATVRCRP